MGHHYENYMGRGKTRKEAESNCVDEFVRENGTRCNLRDVKFISEKKVPPMKSEQTTEWTGSPYNRQRVTRIGMPIPNLDAPKSEWLIEAEFEIHYHS